MNILMRVLTAAFLVSLLAACSTPAGTGAGDSGDGDGGDTATQALDKSTAAQYQTMAVQGSEYQLSMLNEPVSFGTASVKTLSGAKVPSPLTALFTKSGIEPQQMDDCVSESGNSSDVDGDGFPVNATYTYECPDTNPSDEFVFSIFGSASVSDKNDGDAASGYSMTMTDLEYTFGSTGSSGTFTFNLDFDLTITGTQYDATFDFDFAGSSPEGDFSIAFDFDQTYVADSSDPFASGTLTFDGNMSMTSDGDSYSLNVTTTPSLSVLDTCDKGYDSGSAQYSDDFGNVVAVTYSCDSATATYNGETLAGSF